MSEPETTNAVVLAVLVADQADGLISRQVAEVEVSLEGFSGDKHAGYTRGADGRTPDYPRGTRIRNDRQVSMVGREELQQVAERLELAEIQPEWLGANLLLGRFPGLSALPHNTRLRFSGGVVLVVQAENMPCVGPGRVLAEQIGRPELEREFPRAALHLRGLVAVVERGGTLRPGEHLAVSRRRDGQGDL